MRLKDLTYKELIDRIRDINEELIERFRENPKDNADEFTALKDIELGLFALNNSLERQGKITHGD